MLQALSIGKGKEKKKDSTWGQSWGDLLWAESTLSEAVRGC